MAKDSKNEFYEALVALSEFSSIPLEDLVNRIEQGVLKAVRKEYSDIEPEDFDVRLINGNLNVYMMRTVVDDEPTYINEININDAVKVDPDCVLGEKVAFPLDPNKFKRVAVSYAKQSIHHDVREYEKEKLLEEYRDRLNNIMTGVVTKVNPMNGNVTLKLGNNELTLFKSDMLPSDEFDVDDKVCVYLTEMTDKKIPGKKPPKVPIRISRTREDFIRKLFEREVPEILSGEVVIKSVAREAGNRSKVAVFSTVDGIDPIGSCIGPHNSRMHNILKEIGKEKIDLIPYDEDAEKFVGAALSPAKATAVILNEGEERSCTVYVPETQLSLAIGRDGINAKLANRLTGYKLDIKASNGSENMKKSDEEDAAEADVTEETSSAAETEASSEAESTDTSETAETAGTDDTVSAESPEEQE